jgi:hypothetical protein
MKVKNEFNKEEIFNVVDFAISGLAFLQRNAMRHSYIKLDTIYVHTNIAN